MKVFTLKILVILLPFVIVLGFAETRLSEEPKMLYVKSEYIKNHIDEIEVLFMGNSTIFSAVMPDLVHPKSYNLGLPGEHPVKSLALAVQLAPELELLSTVVIGLNYTSFLTSENRLPDEDHNYWRFFDMPPKSRIENSLAFFSMQPKFIVNTLPVASDGIPGFVSTSKGHYYPKKNSGIDLEKSAKKMVERQNRNAQVENFDYNLQRMSKYIKTLEKTGIQVVLLRLPTYSGYYHHQDETFLDLNQQAVSYLLDLCTSCEHIDDSHDEALMQASWYTDSFHFSKEGAIQFSGFLKERLFPEFVLD